MNAIETYSRGILMRSRLEARWLEFLSTATGWRMEYEPFDLDGYIPDAIVMGERPLLIEVKPAASLRECKALGRRAMRAAFKADRDILVVGCSPFLPAQCGSTYFGDTAFTPGVISQRHWPYDRGRAAVSQEEVGVWTNCQECGGLSIVALEGEWSAYPCGHRSKPIGISALTHTDLVGAWADAHNETRWTKWMRSGTES